MKPISILAVFLASCLALAAATLDWDNAANPAYVDGIQPGDDGSVAPSFLGGWVMTEAAAGGKIAIASSLDLGAGNRDVDSSEKAFKLHDVTGGYVDLFRFIDPLGLETGETFSVDIAVNFRGGYKGLDMRDATETSRFTFNVGNDDYVVSKAASGNGSIGSTYAAHTIFRFRFTQDTAEGGTWHLTRSGGVSSNVTGSYHGRIRSLKLYNGGQGDGQEDALYVNNLSITSSEP